MSNYRNVYLQKTGETNWSPVYVNTIEKDGQEMFN